MFHVKQKMRCDDYTEQRANSHKDRRTINYNKFTQKEGKMQTAQITVPDII